MNKEILEKVKTFATEVACVNENEVKPESNFNEDLGMDSLDVVELTMKCESEFRIQITDEDSQNLSSVQELVDLVDSKLNGK